MYGFILLTLVAKLGELEIQDSLVGRCRRWVEHWGYFCVADAFGGCAPLLLSVLLDDGGVFPISDVDRLIEF